MNRLFDFSFFSSTPSTWNRRLSKEEIEKLISSSILVDSKILERTLGLYKPPKRIREIRVTAAAHDQIAVMWWGSREPDAKSPPVILLKYYVYGFGQKPPDTWVDVEILPDLDNWVEETST